MSISVAWSERPPPDDDGIFIPILSAIPRVTLRYVCLSNFLHGVWTHWHQGRTIPHMMPAAKCEGCLAQRAKRWKAYLAVWESTRCRIGLLEVTRDAYRHCEVLQVEPAIDLRGLVLTAWRVGNAAQAPMRIAVNTSLLPEINIPD